MDPNKPQEYSIIESDHDSVITQLSFSPLIISNLLFSVDMDGLVCFWKVSDHCINMMECFSKLQIEGIIFGKWIHGRSSKLLKTIDEKINLSNLKDVNFKLKDIPMGTPAFLSISNSGTIQLFIFDFYENDWKNRTIETFLFIENVDISIKENEISIICNEKNSLCVHVFDWNLRDLNFSKHEFFYVKELTNFFENDLSIKQIKFINEMEIIISTNIHIEKWQKNEKWNFIASKVKSGKIEISKEKIFFLVKETFEILSKDTLEVNYKDNIHANEVAISPNEICFATLNSKLSLYYKSECKMNEISNRIMCGMLNFYDLWDLSLMIKFSDFSFDDYHRETETLKASGCTNTSLEERYIFLVSILKGKLTKILEKNSYLYVKKIYDLIHQNLSFIYAELKINPDRKISEKEKNICLEMIPSIDWIFTFTILFFKSMTFMNSTDKNEKENAFLVKFLFNIQILRAPIEICFVILSKLDTKVLAKSNFKIKEFSDINQRINDLFQTVQKASKKELRKSVQPHFVNNFLVDYPITINKLVTKLDILPSFDGILGMEWENKYPVKTNDIFTSTNLSTTQHRKCKLCGRISNVELKSVFQSFQSSCWICGSYWKLEVF
eukprot:gene10659-3283_t